MATTVQVKEQTLERLKFFKESSKESYDEIINKVLDEVEEGELTDSAIADIKIGLREIREGKGKSIEDVAKEFGLKL
jgi:predicted transcriptional regulator